MVKAINLDDQIQLRHEEVNARKVKNDLLLEQSHWELIVSFEDFLEMLVDHLSDLGCVAVLVVRVISDQSFHCVGLETLDPLFHLCGKCWIIIENFETVEDHQVAVNLDYAVVYAPASLLDLSVELLSIA